MAMNWWRARGRTTQAVGWTVTALAVSAAAIAATRLADRAAITLDTTSWRAEALPGGVADRLDELEDVRLLAAIDGSRAGRGGVRALADALSLFADRGVPVTLIDIADAQGGAQYLNAIAELVERDRRAIDAAEQMARDAIGAARDAAERLSPLTVPFAQQLVRELRTTADAGEAELSRPLPVLAVADGARVALAIAESLRTASGAASDLARSISNPVTSAGVVTTARLLGQAADAARRATTPDALLAADTIAKSEVLLITHRSTGDGPGQIAIDLAREAPAGASPNDTTARLLARIAGGLELLADPVRPVVVFLHAQPPGAGQTAVVRALDPVRRSLASRAIESVVSPIDEATTTLARTLSELDPLGLRDTVHVVIGPQGGDTDAIRRSTEQAELIGDLLEAGDAVMVCLSPSPSAAFGGIDPIAERVALFGVTADTGLTLLAPAVGDATVSAGHRVAATAGSAVGDSAPGSFVVEWATPMDLGEGWSELLLVETDGVWAEREWVAFRQQSVGGQATEAPAPSEEVDVLADRFVIGAKRDIGGRAMVMGSGYWMVPRREDAIGGAAAGQLFEAAVLWLADRDAGLAAGGGETPRITRDAQTLRIARWTVAAGLPLAVLLVGIGFRLIRRK